MNLQDFRGYKLVSVEKNMREDKTATDLSSLGNEPVDYERSVELCLCLGVGGLQKGEIDDLSKWLKEKLSGKATSVTVTNKLENHPCVITVEEMAAARHFVRTQSHQMKEDARYALLQPQLEINPK